LRDQKAAKEEAKKRELGLAGPAEPPAYP